MLLSLALSVAVATAAFVQTPIGAMHEECVHSVPSGTSVRAHPKGGHVATHAGSSWTIPTCPHASAFAQEEKAVADPFPSDYDGWLAYTTAKSPVPFTSFNGTFSVPNSPASVPDMLFSFTGLQNIDWIPKVDPEPSGPFVIIQPVLQYSDETETPWAVRSWYVTLDQGAIASDPLSVQPGDKLIGNMYLVDPKGPTWEITTATAANPTVQTKITVTHDRLAKLPWAYTTIECYGCSDCTYLSTNDQYFTDMVASPANTAVNWVASVTPNPVCHTKAKIVDEATVTYSFQ
jgi:hypothetical protein